MEEQTKPSQFLITFTKYGTELEEKMKWEIKKFTSSYPRNEVTIGIFYTHVITYLSMLRVVLGIHCLMLGIIQFPTPVP